MTFATRKLQLEIPSTFYVSAKVIQLASTTIMGPPVNPYAKKSKTASSTTNPYKRDDQPSSSKTTTSNNHHAVQASPTNPQHHARLPSLPPTIQAATFSQAFADEEPLPPSPKEARTSTEASINLYQHQQQQRQPSGAVPGPLNAEQDRDYHVLLQPHVLYVSTKQRGNDVLKYIRNVPMAVSKMVPDYIMSPTTCALFLSIKYHQLYPLYIHRRIGELRTDFRLRVLLVLVDVEDNANALASLNKLAVTQNMTLILAWTEAEAARYLETYKALDGKDASSIQKRESNNFQEQTADFLTACKPVNKTDAANLLYHFSTIQAVSAASPDELALCEGLGPIKVKKLYEALHKPFSKFKARQRKREREEKEKQEVGAKSTEENVCDEVAEGADKNQA